MTLTTALILPRVREKWRLKELERFEEKGWWNVWMWNRVKEKGEKGRVMERVGAERKDMFKLVWANLTACLVTAGPSIWCYFDVHSVMYILQTFWINGHLTLNYFSRTSMHNHSINDKNLIAPVSMYGFFSRRATLLARSCAQSNES